MAKLLLPAEITNILGDAEEDAEEDVEKPGTVKHYLPSVDSRTIR
jgi:hypothetical protein